MVKSRRAVMEGKQPAHQRNRPMNTWVERDSRQFKVECAIALRRASACLESPVKTIET